MAMAYGNVYVAQIAMGASPQQTVDAFLEAEAHEGPSLIIAYSHCIAHGINMRFGMRQQKLATECGHWPLYRYRPASEGRARQEFVLDSSAPSIPIKTYAYNEIRYKMLAYTRAGGRGTAPRARAAGCGPAVDPLQGHGRALALDRPWRDTGQRQPRDPRDGVRMNLTTRYMGLTLKNPLVASASPLSQRLETIRQLEDSARRRSSCSRCSRSRFVTTPARSTTSCRSAPRVSARRCRISRWSKGARSDRRSTSELIRKAAAAVDIPIIASLNGTTDRGWIDFATLMEEAGAGPSS